MSNAKSLRVLELIGENHKLTQERDALRIENEQLRRLLEAWPAEANCWPLHGEDFDRRRSLVVRTDQALEEKP